MEEIKYSELIEAFKDSKSKDIDFWKKVARIERSIPRYNNKYTWWERAINFCNTYTVERAVAGSNVSIAGLWNIILELNTYDNHDTFHEGRGKWYTDFYFEPTREKTDLKIVQSLNAGIDKYCNDTLLPHGADSLLFYCLDCSKYYMVMALPAAVELDYTYYVFQNKKQEHILAYEVKLPAVNLLKYNKPVSDEDEKEILANLQKYTYIEMKQIKETN